MTDLDQEGCADVQVRPSTASPQCALIRGMAYDVGLVDIGRLGRSR